ncbi:MAG: Nif11-like leader peptide family natural product precursor [Syntrophales bacterium]|nr:Nif11-like leader peptide family natural product precursor [Syntrophales bacterium]MDD5640199.1 Nif11-like leader peptide family natural product precursor [Syntrophales bacterium]
MSIQSAKDFLQKIETDQALKDQLAAAPDHEARQQIVRAAGFDFTVDEFKQAADELAKVAGQELTAEDLHEIAGGAGRAGWCVTHCPDCPSD